MTNEEKCQMCIDAGNGDFDCTDCSLYAEEGFGSYREAYEYYSKLGYKDYGWLNGGANPPKAQYQTAYKNWSGSSTLMVNEEFGIMYSVDMGD